MKHRLGTKIAAILAVVLCLPTNAIADSVAPYGAMRVTMHPSYGSTRDLDTDGRPLTFSESDIFACVQPAAGRPARIFRVPAGYASDQTSIPRDLIQFLVGSSGLNSVYANAAIVHDYLYAVGRPGGRTEADEIMTRLLSEEGVDRTTVLAIRTAFHINQDVDSSKLKLHGLLQLLLEKAPWLSKPVRLLLHKQLLTWGEEEAAAYGRRSEWTRWANPLTLEASVPYASREALPPAELPFTLSNCAVFDRDPPAGGRHPNLTNHYRMHACLHARYASSPRGRARLAVGQDRVDWPNPRMPASLQRFENEVRSRPQSETCAVYSSFTDFPTRRP